jgi:DNA-directed RNA polymerase subunit K/omega
MQNKKDVLDLTSRKNYTNDQLLQKFGSQFELVNYAIKLAENLIKSGRPPRITIDSENPALLVIAEIACSKDQFEEIIEVEKEVATFTAMETPRSSPRAEFSKSPRNKQKVPL